MENEIRVGDRVRSFDFDGRRDCYVEGVVRAIEEREGCDRYVIDVDRIVWNDEPFAPNERTPRTVYPPVNGTRRTFGNVCNGVEKLPEPRGGVEIWPTLDDNAPEHGTPRIESSENLTE